ncbi:MAG: class I SAM-dependent methyltransferase [Patescibacteria group bacterium]|nr:class I SAM-dependent methyltransferase [Patescibacteria group bacterium]
MTELELLIDFYKDTDRQGPGSSYETMKALNLTGINKKDDLKIVDIGCGSGAQTIVLAQNTNGQIIGVDLFPEFLDKLENDAMELGLQDKITTLKKPMEDLPFDKEEFDIIWAEGAIYNMGFEAGIKKWKDYLKSGGYLCVSEITWITDSRPKEIEEYWNGEYPEIDTASNKIKKLEKNGYSPVGYFYLEQDSWIRNYYAPLEKRFSVFLEKHNNSEMAKNIVQQQKGEIALYKKYKEYYSYGFYIAKNI